MINAAKDVSKKNELNTAHANDCYLSYELISIQRVF